MRPTATAPLDSVDTPARALQLLKPFRVKILEQALEPRSATEIAARLGRPRQLVNYHVRELRRHGFLRPAGTRRKRNLIEQRYQASARAYTLSPVLLGSLRPSPGDLEDRFSSAYLLALASRLQQEVERARDQAAHQRKRLATWSLDCEFRFESPEQRETFARKLEQAVRQAVAEATSPFRGGGGRPARGRPYRLVVGCHPLPPESGPPSGTPREEGEEE